MSSSSTVARAAEFARRVETAASALRERLPLSADGPPVHGVILGSGLGGLIEELSDPLTVNYDEIPGFPASTAPGHSGRLHFGRVGEHPVIAFEGRFHFYEGYDLAEITMPVRLLARLGAKSLVVTNACGGMNLDYQKGDLMIIDDHINLIGANPLTGPNFDDWGPRFPDMCEPYDRELMNRWVEIAEKENIRVHTGVYVAVAGPNLETRAEYRMLQGMGADVVGMSTVPEVIVAVHEGLRVAGISVVTDLCDPDNLQAVSVDEILAVAAEAEPKLTRLIAGLIQS